MLEYACLHRAEVLPVPVVSDKRWPQINVYAKVRLTDEYSEKVPGFEMPCARLNQYQTNRK